MRGGNDKTREQPHPKGILRPKRLSGGSGLVAVSWQVVNGFLQVREASVEVGHRLGVDANEEAGQEQGWIATRCVLCREGERLC